ncbi:MAG TPA: AI-2E family transporter [Pirellulales bacterium]|jgi:predicted PurR-regulated permease PerM|nr:AI-2E family transporter [Pirellulales bacterium]
MAKVSLTPSQRYTQFLATASLSVAVLYFGREILIPLAAAVLFTFLISPLVQLFERGRIGRVASVLLSVLLIFSTVAVAGVAIGRQLADLAARLPAYETNLKEKLHGLRFTGGPLEKIESTLKEVSEEVESGSRDIQVVRVEPADSLPLDRARVVAESILAPAASAGLVVVLVIFMLISREDLRNRLVRLAGRKLALTTRTLDEIGTRISRYLFFNAIVNGSFGVAVAAGLALIGVEYAFTWGLLAALLRFIPYLGPVLATVPPLLLALMQFPGWLHPAMAGGLFLVLELITNNVVEPLVYGRSTGVSTVALLVAAMFWTWVWGPIGLILAVPLTVILAVIGEHVSALEPLAILLGDKPPLDPHVTYYQRLLAGDLDEASAILQERVRSVPVAQALDDVVMPALVLAEWDLERDELLAEDHQQLLQSTREFLDEAVPDNGVPEHTTTADKPDTAAPRTALRARVLGCPARDMADETGLMAVRKSLDIRNGGCFEILSLQLLASEMLTEVEKAGPDAVLISCLAPQAAQQTRYLCKRLRQNFPRLRIIVGRWGFKGDRARLAATLKARGADQVVTTISEASDVLARVQPIEAATQAAMSV